MAAGRLGAAALVATVALVIAAEAAAGAWGGLVERWEWPAIAQNLAPNPSFEEHDGRMPSGWTANSAAWSLSSDVARTGSASLRLYDSHQHGPHPIASTPVRLEPGWYSLSGWVKSQFPPGGQTRRGGVRVQIPRFVASGNIVGEAADWTRSSAALFKVAEPLYSSIQVVGWGKPDGTFWIDDIELVRHVAPDVEIFLVYPNFLGRLWSDGPQIVRASVRGKPGRGRLVLAAEGGAVAASLPVAVTPTWTRVELPVAGLADGVYRLRLDIEAANHRPEYRIVKGAPRPPIRLDEDNVWVQPDARGVPTRRFPILVYHTSGYPPANEARWAQQLEWMDELPYDIYLNYWLGRAPLATLQALGRFLASRGRSYLDTINDKYEPRGPHGQPDAADLEPRSRALGGQPGIAGWYTADERRASWAAATFAQRQLVRELAPTMPALIVQNRPPELPMWRDVADVIGVDPYPLHRRGHLSMSMVADYTAAAVEAGQGARPVWTVLQFFQAAGFRWPTAPELRSMSWLAICTGANGLGYWSLGAKGLGWVKDEARRAELWKMLVEVVREIKRHEAALIAPAVPDFVALPAGVVGVARRTGAREVTVFTCNGTGAEVRGEPSWPAAAERAEVIDGGAAWEPFGTRAWRVTLRGEGSRN